MTPAQIDAVAARAAAATEGPWAVKGGPGSDTVYSTGVQSRIADLGYTIAKDGANAEFIAHARTDVVELLTALREARESIAKVTRVMVEAVAKRVEAEADRDAAIAHVAELEADVEAVGRDLDTAERWRAQFMAERDTALSSLADAQTFAKFQKDKIDGLRAAGEEARAFVRLFLRESMDNTMSDYLEAKARALLAKETT